MNSTNKIAQWDRFEGHITNDKAYAYPYNDISLNVTYVRPDGSRIAFWGFYDGECQWKFRFMPDQLGTWTYEADFSDETPGVSGSFECVASDIPGMLHKDETNPAWFGFKGGGHVLVRSFHVGDCYFSSNLSDEDRTAFLDWAQRQGYNMLSIASHYINRQAPGRGLGWDTPKLWPLDAKEYQRMERLLDELAARRILVFPFAGFFGREGFFPNAERDQVLYIKYTLARLGAYWNVLLNVAGPEPILRSNAFLPKSEVDRLGHAIQSFNVSDHLLTVHNQTGDDDYRHETYTSYVTLQGPKTTSRSLLSRGLLRNRRKNMPLYAQETLWPGNIHGHPNYTDEDIRKNGWVVNMSAAALNFADHNGDSSSGFSGFLRMEDRVQSRHDIIKQVWDFFDIIPFYRMNPRQDLIDNGYCLAEPGRQYLVYLEEGGMVNVRVEDGPAYIVEWINARNTTERISGGTTEGGTGLTAPDGQDWLVYLTR